MKLRSVIAVMLLCAMLMSLCACGQQRDITDDNANVYIDGDRIVDVDGIQLNGFTADADGNIKASGSDTIFVKAENSRYFVPLSDIAYEAQDLSVLLDARITKNKNADPTVSVIPTAFSISLSLMPFDATCQKLTVTIPNDGSVDFDRALNNIVTGSERRSSDMASASVTIRAIDGHAELCLIGKAEGPVSITVSAFDGHGASIVLPISMSVSDVPSEIVDGDDVIDAEELSRTDIVEDSDTFVGTSPISGFICVKSAELRRGPGAKYNVLGTCSYGSGVNILGYDGDWVKVYILFPASYGYVKRSQVDRVPAQGNTASDGDITDIPGAEVPGGSEIPGGSDVPGGSEIPGGSDVPGGTDVPGGGDGGGNTGGDVIPDPPAPEPPPVEIGDGEAG